MKALEEADKAQQEQQTVKENVAKGEKTMGTWGPKPGAKSTSDVRTAGDMGADKVDKTPAPSVSGGTQIVGFH